MITTFLRLGSRHYFTAHSSHLEAAIGLAIVAIMAKNYHFAIMASANVISNVPILGTQ